MGPADPRHRRRAVMASRKALGSQPSTPGLLRSELTCRYAPSSTTPEGPPGAHARFFPDDSRLQHLWEIGRPSRSVSRPNQVRFRYGSHLRLPRLRRRGSPRPPLGRLHVERAIHMATSFQVARSARLTQRTRAAKKQGELGGASPPSLFAPLRLGARIPPLVAPAIT